MTKFLDMVEASAGMIALIAFLFLLLSLLVLAINIFFSNFEAPEVVHNTSWSCLTGEYEGHVIHSAVGWSVYTRGYETPDQQGYADCSVVK